MNANKPPIAAEMDIEDLVRDYPEAVRRLTRMGIICIQCGAPVWGTLGEIIARVGQDIDRVIAALNDFPDKTRS